VCECSCACVRAGGGEGGTHTDACRLNRNSNLLRPAFLFVCLLFAGLGLMCCLRILDQYRKNTEFQSPSFGLPVCVPAVCRLGIIVLFTGFRSVPRNMEFQSFLSRFLRVCLLFARVRLDSCLRGLD